MENNPSRYPESGIWIKKRVLINVLGVKVKGKVHSVQG